MSSPNLSGSGKLSQPLVLGNPPTVRPPDAHLRSPTGSQAEYPRKLQTECRLLTVDADADKLRELEIREDIIKRVQRLQLRSSVTGRQPPTSAEAVPSAVKVEAPGRPARGETELVPWDADVEEGELACTIS